MKVATMSDIHFNAFKPFANYVNGENTRMTEIADAFTFAVDDAKTRGCDIMLIPGDVFHTRGAMRPSVFNRAVDLIAQAAHAMPIVIIPGNHDMENYKGGATAVDTLAHISNVHVIKEAGIIEVRGLKILGVPYIHNHKDFLETFKEMAKEDFDCAMIHQGIDSFVSATGIPETGVTAEALSAITGKPIFAGHYHVPRHKLNVVSPGSLVAHSFGDSDEERGYWVWDTKSGSLDTVAIPGPRFATASTLKAVEAVPTGYYVRVEAGTASTAEKLKAAALAGGAKGVVARINKKFKTAHSKKLNLAGPKEMLVEFMGMMDETKEQVPELMSLFEEICEGGAA